eukprot:5088479-Amphidinium_carterae.1
MSASTLAGTSSTTMLLKVGHANLGNGEREHVFELVLKHLMRRRLIGPVSVKCHRSGWHFFLELEANLEPDWNRAKR